MPFHAQSRKLKIPEPVEKTFSTSGTARVKTLAVFVVLSPARTYRGQVRYVKGGLSPPFSCGMKLPT